jgi:hypothetical protein
VVIHTPLSLDDPSSLGRFQLIDWILNMSAKVPCLELRTLVEGGDKRRGRRKTITRLTLRLFGILTVVYKISIRNLPGSLGNLFVLL